MFRKLKTPVIIGHRGASLYAPENTMASFNMALEQSAAAIEFDVKLTSDDQVVVIHDPQVERTTDGQGLVSKLSLDSIKKLDAGSWFSNRFIGERIPTLEEVFDSFGRKTLMNIELTNYTTPSDNLVERVIDLVNRMNLKDHVYFSSFMASNLIRATKLLPGCGIGYLTYAGPARLFQNIIQPSPSSLDSVNPHYSAVTIRMVQREHSKGRRVLVYTVNNPDEMRRLFLLGVDGVFTDDPLTGNKVALEFNN